MYKDEMFSPGMTTNKPVKFLYSTQTTQLNLSKTQLLYLTSHHSTQYTNMKLSFALVTVLAGLALATPSNPAARAEAAAAEVADVGAPNAEQLAEVNANVQALAALDPACVSCVRRNCGASWICLRATAAPLVIACLLARCAAASAICCVF
jgi:hypothetical protein